jgi:hypothetical protein
MRRVASPNQSIVNSNEYGGGILPSKFPAGSSDLKQL